MMGARRYSFIEEVMEALSLVKRTAKEALQVNRIVLYARADF